MAQFLIGDELGNIKRLHYNPNPPNADDPKTTIKTVLNGSTSASSVQTLSTSGDGNSRMVCICNMDCTAGEHLSMILLKHRSSPHAQIKPYMFTSGMKTRLWRLDARGQRHE